MARELSGSRAEVVDVRRLSGGVDAATHAVRLDPGGWCVVKRVRQSAVGSLAGEFDRLRFAQRAPVATPEPVALDVEGSWFGHPALVMGLVAGRSVVHDGTGSWIDELAETLAAVHSTALDGEIPSVLRAPHAGSAWQPGSPSELPRTDRVLALIDAGLSLSNGSELDGSGDVLLHHDFHHGNVLWRAGQVTGVVDWNEACLGPALCDVGYCSVDGWNPERRRTRQVGIEHLLLTLADLDEPHSDGVEDQAVGESPALHVRRDHRCCRKDIVESLPVSSHKGIASASTCDARPTLRFAAGTTSTSRLRVSAISRSRPRRPRRPTSPRRSTSRSTSLALVSSPRATLPNTRTFVAPRRSAASMMDRRR